MDGHRWSTSGDATDSMGSPGSSMFPSPGGECQRHGADQRDWLRGRLCIWTLLWWLLGQLKTFSVTAESVEVNLRKRRGRVQVLATKEFTFLLP